MGEIVIFSRNLCITFAVIAVPLLLLWRIERYKLNKTKKSVEEIPQELREMHVEECTADYEIGKQKMKYAMRNLGKGLAIYALFLIPGIFRFWGRWEEISEYLMIPRFFWLSFFFLR